MLIGIDGNEANVEKRVGVHQYAFELLKNIHKLQDEWRDKYQVIVYLKNPPRKGLPKETSFWRYKVIKGRGFWVLTKLMPNLLFDKEKPDVFFTPSHYLPPLTPMPKVCTIHDLGYLKFSAQFKKYDFWQLKIWSAISISVSKAIIAISNSTKNDIVRHYPFASKKTVVIHHGYDKEWFSLKVSQEDVRRVRKKYSIVSDYVLFISTLKPSKNIEGLLEAWKIVRRKFSRYKLVIAGRKGWLYKPIFEKVKHLGLESAVVFTDFVAEEDKPALIRGARLFVLPSFWEGFGMDVINALACGTPAVISKVASLPEVAGEAGVYIDPYEASSIAEGITKVLSMDKVKYNNLIEKGLIQAKKFSWQETARKTISVLEKAGGLK